MGALTDAKVRNARAAAKAYKLTDGGQLYLHVSTAGGRTWRMNYQFGRNSQGNPVQKTLTIGTYPAISLKDARDARDVAKALLAKGSEPKPDDLFERAAPAEDTRPTFKAIGSEWHDLQKARWSKVHAKDVLDNLDNEVFAEIGDMPIVTIDAPTVFNLLRRIAGRGAVRPPARLVDRQAHDALAHRRGRLDGVILHDGDGATEGRFKGFHAAVGDGAGADSAPAIGRLEFVPLEPAAGRVGGFYLINDPERANAIQKLAVEKSRLGIPLLFGLDAIHGMRTIFPVPFGYGLSYTGFAYADVKASAASIATGQSITLSATVRNVGARTGDEVVQLYLHQRTGAARPVREFKGFHRVTLKPDETRTLRFEIKPQDRAFWNAATRDWSAGTGAFDFWIGGDAQASAAGSFVVEKR